MNNDVNGLTVLNRAEAELARLERSEPIRMAVDGTTWTGNWGAVKWTDLELCGNSLCELFAQILEVEIIQISLEKFERLENDHVWIGVRLSLNKDAAIIITAELSKSLDAAALRFFDKINYQRDFSDSTPPVLVAHFDSIIEDAANEFLQTKGGKRIGTPLQITGFQKVTICSGLYREKPAVLPSSPKERVIFGVADGIRFSTKTLKVLSSGAEHDILFNPQFFFERLLELLKDQKPRIFNIFEQSDAKGIVVLTLRDIGSEIEGTEKLI